MLRDLTEAIVVGFALGARLFIHRMSRAVEVAPCRGRRARRGPAIYLTGATPALRRTLLTQGVRPPLVHYAATIETALAAARRRGLIPAAA